MTPQEVWDAVAAALATASIEVRDEIQTTPERPYYLLGLSAGHASRPTVGGRGNRLRVPFSLMGVNNSAGGCRFLMSRAMDLLEGRKLEPHGHPLACDVSPTDPFAEDGPGLWRWSSTALFAYFTHRGDRYAVAE